MERTILKLDLPKKREFEFECGQYTLRLGQATKIMGILNVTPDSFSNDGIYADPTKAKDVALQMVGQGADIIDLGGESTRPGAKSISAEEEQTRILPVIKKIAKKVQVPISIDTSKSEVASAALQEGASIVNDISGLKFDAHMPETVAQFAAGVVLMHIKDKPQTMQHRPFYTCLMEEIVEALNEQVDLALAAGINRKGIVIDPGIGFGKTTEHNLQIIKQLMVFNDLNLPILIGPSRKSFIGNVLNLPVQTRLLGTAASVVASIFNGAHIVRVHDVQEMLQVCRMADAILNS